LKDFSFKVRRMWQRVLAGRGISPAGTKQSTMRKAGKTKRYKVTHYGYETTSRTTTARTPEVRCA